MSVSPINAGELPFDPVAEDLRTLRETAEKVVGLVFYGAMLKAMRDSGIKGEYGHGGRGEEVFAAQLHNLYAERLGGAQSGGLPSTLYRTLEKQQRAISEAYAQRTYTRPMGMDGPARSNR